MSSTLLILLPTLLFAQSQHCLTALDGSLTACLDAATGSLASLLALPSRAGPPLPFALASGGTLLRNAQRTGNATVTATPSSVSVRQAWAFLPPAPPGSGATVVDTFSPAATAIAWEAEVRALPGGGGPWSVPIATSLRVAPATLARTKLWAPWDRDSYTSFPGSWVDPLQPSDALPSGWWDGHYRYGTPRGAGSFDWIVAPYASLLGANGSLGSDDAGVSLALWPGDLPLDVALELQGSDPVAPGLAFSREHARLDPAAPEPLRLRMHLVGHAADWRAGLAWATREHAQWWEPVNAQAMLSAGGLGSYSYYGDDTTDSLAPYADALKAMSYGVNWDLSGRYFPCVCACGCCAPLFLRARAHPPPLTHTHTHSALLQLHGHVSSASG